MNGREDIALRILNLDTIWRLIGELEGPGALAQEKEPPIPLGRKVVAPDRRGEVKYPYHYRELKAGHVAHSSSVTGVSDSPQ